MVPCENSLASCGVAVASIGWITGRIRAAFDPHLRPEIASPTRTRY